MPRPVVSSKPWQLPRSPMDEPIGLIAGEGQLPILTARGIRAAGRRVVCVGLRGQYHPDLPPLCDAFAPAGIARLGRWIRLLRRWGAHQAIMIGRVKKQKMYDPWRYVRQLPDWRAAKIWFFRLRHDRRTATLLTAVAEELEKAGVRLIDSTTYIPEHLAVEGPMTRRQPTASQLADIAFALPLVRKLAELDIGQALAVKDREVIAVEAMEGTDAMVQRVAQLCPRGGWTLLKAARPGHDRRFDVPTIGLQTIRLMAQARAACLAVEAGQVILVDKPAVLAAADAAGIAVLGFK